MTTRLGSLSRWITPEERFFLSADFGGDEQECVEWMGGLGRLAYPQFQINGKLVQARRFSYEYFRDIVVGKSVIEMLCENTNCVNPDHMELITRKESLRRNRTTAAMMKEVFGG